MCINCGGGEIRTYALVYLGIFSGCTFGCGIGIWRSRCGSGRHREDLFRRVSGAVRHQPFGWTSQRRISNWCSALMAKNDSGGDQLHGFPARVVFCFSDRTTLARASVPADGIPRGKRVRIWELCKPARAILDARGTPAPGRANRGHGIHELHSPDGDHNGSEQTQQPGKQIRLRRRPSVQKIQPSCS